MESSQATIVLIAAHIRGKWIGENNELLFRLKEDLRRFKQHTMGKPIIMGRKTYESIGKPLPGRCNIIVSRSMTDDREDYKVCNTLESAIKYAQEYIKDNSSDLDAKKIAKEIMIIGGGNIYKQALPMANKLLITEIRKNKKGDPDVSFPDYDTKGMWCEDDREEYSDEGVPCVFKVIRPHQPKLALY